MPAKELVMIGLRKYIPKQLLKWKKSFCFVLCSQAAFGENSKDFESLSPSDLPSWLTLNTLYFFNHEEELSDHEYSFKIQPLDILMYEQLSHPSLGSKPTLYIELAGKSYFLRMKYATDVNNLQKAIELSKRVDSQISRTRFGYLAFSSEYFISIFKERVNNHHL